MEDQRWREEIEDEEEIAEKMNEFFVQKIADLKNNIDPELKKDPLDKLKKKVEGKNLRFTLKPVTEKKVEKAMKQMKKKKSCRKGRGKPRVPATRDRHTEDPSNKNNK